MRSVTLSLLSLLLLASPLVQANPEEAFEFDALDPRSLFDTEPHALLQQRDEQPHGFEKRALGKSWSGTTKLKAAGTSGVGAMQIAVVSDDEILIYDKGENNALKAKNGKSAWGALYTISTAKVRALNLKTNTFCAGGGWISNGTMVSVGGNPTENSNQAAADGIAGVRLFTPGKNADVYESPDRIRLTSKRWYPSTIRLQDGSLMILGGMILGGFNNVEATDNPTFEFYPPKGNGLQFYSKFLHDALNSNLFPITAIMPGTGYVFVAANHISMLYDWKTNTERRLPAFPNGVAITYPAGSASVLLPLTVANKWTPEMLICGGTVKGVNVDEKPWKLSSQTLTSNQCQRMVLNSAGIKKKWVVEKMPEARLMGDGVLTPDGKVFLVNGARRGIEGYGNVKDSPYGSASNAADPVFRPTLYDPVAKAGQRFSTNFPTSKIERLYHSSATLIPDGRIFVTGSNSNDRVSKVTYATRYEVEMFSPPYMARTRPTYSAKPVHILYNKKFTININVLSATKTVRAVIMDLGYSTHGVHMSSRFVELVATRSGTKKLVVTGPKDGTYYPPGYAWLHILADDVPSKAYRVMIGSGASPPVSKTAIANMLKKTGGNA